MRCPVSLDLPLPLQDLKGWPWVEESSQSTKNMPDGNQWPKVSIITPSFNQGDFLEETIRSVLLQGYPNLEYIIVDGGSTDSSVGIIKKYEPWLAYWISEPDRGQTHAINKGFNVATGDIVAWLNSDDTYLPDTLHKAMTAFNQNPSISLVFGSALFINEESKPINVYKGRPLSRGLSRMKYWKGWGIPQPTLFFKSNLLHDYGGLDENYHYALDYEWIIRVSRQEKLHFINDILATYRIHLGSKTSDWNESKPLFFNECDRANRKYASPDEIRNYPLWLSWEFYKIKESMRRIKSNFIIFKWIRKKF
jgi:glycosyltransferase involved in cell wall biosynthesis